MKRNMSERKILETYDNIGKLEVISFEGDRRACTYAGIDALTAAKYITQQTLIGRSVIVFPYGTIPAGECTREKSYYEQKAKEFWASLSSEHKLGWWK